jgi:enoyl-CoA hydratase/carnithine racemase
VVASRPEVRGVSNAAGAEREIDTGTDEVRCRVAERVAVVTLNRPEAKNALTMDMKRALNALLPALASDTSVGCVLLTGAGGAFCSGGDTKRMKQEGKPPSLEDRIRQLRWEHQIPLALYRMPKPTLAALPGAAAGAGLALALACDLRLASESLVATTAYARLGLSGDYGSSWFLTQLVGTARARELMYTPGRLDARTCLELGLVNRVVADEQLDKEATAWAREIASGPPIALRYMKDNLNRALVSGLEECLDLEADRMPAGAQTEDYLEAVAAFSEKRKPVFRGH